MTREEALQLIKEKVKNQNSIKHMLATEAIMRALARHFGEDEELWGLAGLVHDVDMEMVDYKTKPEEHGKVGVEILRSRGVPEEIISAVLAHNEKTGEPRKTLIQKVIYSIDPLTGLIVAATLVLPEKKLAYLTVQNVLNRFKEKSFAKGAKREIIVSCEEFGLSIEEFVTLGLKAMQKISWELGL